MHKDLEAWLNQVWADKDRIIAQSPTGHSGRGIHLLDKNPAIWEVYDIYNSSEGSGGISSAGDATVKAFIDDLNALEEETHIGATIQVGNSFVQLVCGELVMLKNDRTLGKKTTDGKKDVTLDCKQIGHCFVHFVKKQGAMVRIYLNVRIAHLGGAFRRIFSLIHDQPSLRSAKVTGPLGSVRADSIVIYLSSRRGLEPVIGKIREYYLANKGHFGAATPKLTAPVPDLPGVAIGMEPPSITLVRSGGDYYFVTGGQSFGFYRASLIFMALDRTHFKVSGQTDNDRANAFKRRAAKYFLAAGIDPNRPSEQLDKDLTKVHKPIAELEFQIEGDLDDKGREYNPGAKVHVKKK